jgi:hypothetical protein
MEVGVGANDAGVRAEQNFNVKLEDKKLEEARV